MKHTLLLLTLLSSLLELSSQNSFTISGHLKNMVDQEMILMQRKNYDDVELCRTKSVNGNFTLNGTIDEPDLVMLDIIRADVSLKIFLDPSTITIQGDLNDQDKIQISGSRTHDEYSALYKTFIPYQAKFEPIIKRLNAAKEKNDADAYRIAYDEYKIISDSRDKVIIDYFKAHRNSIVAASYIAPLYYNVRDVDQLKEIRNIFGPDLKQTKHYAFFNNAIETLEKLAPGKKAPDFTLKTPEGHNLSLSSLKGKYVLIDFWASWCGPCRKENPNVVALYNTYKHRNFEILGVSLDTSKENWEKAISDDKLAWKHVSDLRGWKSSAAQLYNVKSIPHTLLLKPDGTILAKNLRGEELKAKLEEIFK